MSVYCFRLTQQNTRRVKVRICKSNFVKQFLWKITVTAILKPERVFGGIYHIGRARKAILETLSLRSKRKSEGKKLWAGGGGEKQKPPSRFSLSRRLGDPKFNNFRGGTAAEPASPCLRAFLGRVVLLWGKFGGVFFSFFLLLLIISQAIKQNYVS